jgi:5-methyltetrahydrofolate--homocysteine methyltransferase
VAAPADSRGLGLPRPAGLTMHDRFTSKYRGKRYSFGYPACPNLDDQQGLFTLLRPKTSACSSPKA